MKIKFIIILLIGMFTLTTAKSQFNEIYVGAGITGTNIFTNNPATKPIFMKEIKNKELIVGGSFDGVETGFLVKGETNIDDSANFFIPFSFEYVWLNANELYWANMKTKIQLSHAIDIQKIATGLKWYFYKFPFQEVRPFLGFDVKGVFVNNISFTWSSIETSTGKKIVVNRETKPTAFRLGGEIYTGFRGMIIDEVFLTATFGVELLNAIGKDNSRGELLTPFVQNETEEKYVPNYHISLLIEYKF